MLKNISGGGGAGLNRELFKKIFWVLGALLLISGALVLLVLPSFIDAHRKCVEAGFGSANIISTILAISYIFSGIEIQRTARQIWDADLVEYKDTKKKFQIAHRRLAQNESILKNRLGALKDYGRHYKDLDEQYDRIKANIFHVEDATLDVIVQKTKDQNPTIDPVKTRDVKEAVLKEREEANEKLHKEKKESYR